MSLPQPALSTERLQLLPAEPVWTKPVLAYLKRNQAHFAPWEPTPGGMYYTELFWSMRLQQRQEDWREGRGATFLLMLDKEPGEIIGMITLSNIVRGVFQACHLGYNIDLAHEGQGKMREALEAVVQFAFGPLRLHRVQANYQPENLRSAGLLQRLGFEIEGQAKDYLFLNGAWRDHVLTSRRHPGFDTKPFMV